MPKRALQLDCTLVRCFWQKNILSLIDFEILLKVVLKPLVQFLIIRKFIANSINKIIIGLKNNNKNSKNSDYRHDLDCVELLKKN